MYSEDDLTSAVHAGVMSGEDAAAFREYVAHLRAGPLQDEEHFRLVTGFNDIFVVIACVLSLGSLAWIGTLVASWFGVAAQSGAAWLLAENFTRKRRMALPSIVLLLSFVGGVLATGYIILDDGFGVSQELALAVSSVVAAIAALAHWLRFKVPITVAAGTATVVAASILFVLVGVPAAREWINAITVCAGVVVFVMALVWDASDTLRQTRRSDVAFWLPLVAAPLLVHPIFSFLAV